MAHELDHHEGGPEREEYVRFALGEHATRAHAAEENVRRGDHERAGDVDDAHGEREGVHEREDADHHRGVREHRAQDIADRERIVAFFHRAEREEELGYRGAEPHHEEPDEDGAHGQVPRERGRRGNREVRAHEEHPHTHPKERDVPRPTPPPRQGHRAVGVAPKREVVKHAAGEDEREAVETREVPVATQDEREEEHEGVHHVVRENLALNDEPATGKEDEQHEHEGEVGDV